MKRFTLSLTVVLALVARAGAATLSDFHYATMFGGGRPHGTIPAHVLLLGFSDQPSTHTPAEYVQKLFGPGANAASYFMNSSRGILTITNGGAWGPLSPPDDPDTVLDESTARDSTDMTIRETLFFGMQTRTGKFVTAVSGGGSTVAAGAPGVYEWETMALVAVSTRDGLLYSGDTIAIKTPLGYFLRNAAGTIRGDGAGYTVTDRRFVITKVSGSAGGEIVNGDGFTLRSVATGKYVRAVGGGDGAVLADLAAPTADSTFTHQKTSTDGLRINRMVVDLLIGQGVDFAAKDTNHDGVVTTSEFLFWGIGVSAVNDGQWGQNRNPASRYRPAGATVDVDFAQAYVGGGSYLHTFAHEMAHSLETVDLYGHDGSRNTALTLMGGEFDGLSYLDPWHRMRLGWLQPRIFAMSVPAHSEVLTMPEQVLTTGPGVPIILYDPARYDVTARSGEYFIIEFRNGVAPSTLWDRGVAVSPQPVGLAVWQVETDGAGNALIVPPAGGAAGIDRAVNALGAPVPGIWEPYVRGNWELWKDTDGVIRPPYRDDLTPANVKIRIAPSVVAASQSILVCITPASDANARCAPCAARVGIERVSLKISKLNNAAADDKLSFKGEMTVPASPALAPVTKGVRLVLEDGTGAFADETIPGGAYNAATRSGWTGNSSGTSWTFRSSSGFGGISKISMRTVAAIPGLVRFKVTARNAGFRPLGVAVRASFIVDPPFATSGQCGETSSALGCAYNGSFSTLVCR